MIESMQNFPDFHLGVDWAYGRYPRRHLFTPDPRPQQLGTQYCRSTGPGRRLGGLRCCSPGSLGQAAEFLRRVKAPEFSNCRVTGLNRAAQGRQSTKTLVHERSRRRGVRGLALGSRHRSLH